MYITLKKSNTKIQEIGVQNKTITRTNFCDSFSSQFLLQQSRACFLLEIIIDEIIDSLSSTETLKISSFGTFVVHHKKQRLGRNPKTGQEALISARKSISFRPSQILRDKVARKMGIW